MNAFSSMEINDLLDNRFRIEQKHNLQYLAECFQRLFPTLGRMSLPSIAEEMARANSRAFNSSKLPIRGETLDLGFFFELWKRGYRFEGGIYDKFVFTDELRLAFKLNPREFWDILIRADREIGTYLKDSFIAYNMRELPKELSINTQLRGSNVDANTIRRLKEKLPTGKDNLPLPVIARTLLQLFEMPSPSDYETRSLAELLEKENGIKHLQGEPFSIIPKKALDRLSTKCVLEFFKNKPLASAEVSAMEKGIYTLTEADILLASKQGSEVFWQSIIPDKNNRDNTLSARTFAGMNNDASRFSKGDKILVVTAALMNNIKRQHSQEIRIAQTIGLHAGVAHHTVEDFMVKIFACHNFYQDLPDFNVDYGTLKNLKQGE